MFSPSVITSKAASKDLENIRSAHADILRGLAVQSEKVNSYNKQKAAAMVAQNEMKSELQKQNIADTSAASKNANDFAIKQGELDIKRAQISLK